MRSDFSLNIPSAGSGNEKNKEKGNGNMYSLRRGNTFTLQCVALIYIHAFYFYSTFRFLPRKCTSVVRKITRDGFWCALILHLDTEIHCNKVCSLYVSASLYQLMLLVVGGTALIRKYAVLIGDPIAVQILTHNPYLSSVSQYPAASESPRAEARHHQPNLSRAPTPRAFARVSSLLHRQPPYIRYRTYLVLLFNATGEENKYKTMTLFHVLFVQSHYTLLLSILVAFCFEGVLF